MSRHAIRHAARAPPGVRVSQRAAVLFPRHAQWSQDTRFSDLIIANSLVSSCVVAV